MSPAIRLRRIPAATRNDDRLDAKRLATAVSGLFTRRFWKAYSLVWSYPLQELRRRKSTTTVEDVQFRVTARMVKDGRNAKLEAVDARAECYLGSRTWTNSPSITE